MPAISIARVLAVALGLSACRDHASGDKPHTSAPSPTAANAQTAQRPSGTIDIVELPDGQPLLTWIANEVARATKDSKTAIVYVGATWCEPCETFARAVRAGKLDREFPTLRLLHVDLDAHQDELNVAGYNGEMIPLFAEPRADGQASGRKIQGAVKGEAAIAHIVPRLRALLAPPQ